MKLCGACLDENKANLKPLVANDEIFDLFNDITALNIYLSDGLPSWLCKKCVNLLKRFKKFRKQCRKSHNELKARADHDEIDTTPELLTVFVDTVGFSDAVEDEIDSGHLGEMHFMEENGRNPANNACSYEDTKPSVTEEEYEFAKNEDKPKPLVIKVRKKKSKYKLNQKAEYQLKHSYAYQCEKCGRGFHYKERYEGHLREHEGKSAAVCEFCNSEYSEWSGLRKHMVIMHQDEMKYICKECGQKFIYESGLIAHNSKHYGPRKHMCETCGKSFADAYSLGKHMLAHTDETPFECNVCGKKFKSDKHLKAHHFRHLGIKKFSCNACGKSFTTRPELKQHMRVHSDTKEFQCPTCHQYFRQKNQLSVHQRSHMFE